MQMIEHNASNASLMLAYTACYRVAEFAGAISAATICLYQ